MAKSEFPRFADVGGGLGGVFFADPEHGRYLVTDTELENTPEGGKTRTGLTTCSTLSPTEQVEFVRCEAAAGAFNFFVIFFLT